MLRQRNCERSFQPLHDVQFEFHTTLVQLGYIMHQIQARILGLLPLSLLSGGRRT
eukprot:UN2808